LSFIKKAGMEPSGISDPDSGLPIRVSTTARKLYRHWFRGQELGQGTYSRINYGSVRNKDLNQLIAQDFGISSNGIVHQFRCKHSSCNSQDPEIIQIRLAKSAIGGKKNPFNYFFAINRGSTIDIITLTGRYMKRS